MATRAAQRAARAAAKTNRRQPQPAIKLAADPQALKKLKLVAVAYSHVEREWFPTDEAYEAEVEVEQRAQEMIAELEKLGIPAKGYPGDQYFLTNLLVDRPDLVVNLVDTLRGKDALSTTVPAALEMANIPYTGAGMQGLVIGSDRNLFKQLLVSSDIPTPPFQYITRRRKAIDPELGLPLIVKLNESGGSVGIDNDAVKETVDEAEDRVNELLSTYRIPVIVERFIDGLEVTVAVFDDGQKKHIFPALKKFGKKPDGKHYFTSQESYQVAGAYKHVPLDDEALRDKITKLADKAFTVLKNKDYAKFDVRVDEETGTPYFTDCNPNTAIGPSDGLPFTEILGLYRLSFADFICALIGKHAKQIERNGGQAAG